MALELLMEETRLVARPPTGPVNAPLVKRPDYRIEASDALADLPRTPDAPNLDGVRILDPIAPLQRSRYYYHELGSRLEVLQSWEGAVTSVEVDAGSFTARLMDLGDTTGTVSEAEFDMSDVSENDLDLLRAGGVFRWMIGYRHYNYGKRERVSAIVFRRLPVWNEDDVAEAAKEGERLAGSIRPR